MLFQLGGRSGGGEQGANLAPDLSIVIYTPKCNRTEKLLRLFARCQPYFGSTH